MAAKGRGMAGFSLGGAKRPGAQMMAQPGTTEHAVLMLVLVELGALIVLRRYMRGAHGG